MDQKLSFVPMRVRRLRIDTDLMQPDVFGFRPLRKP